MHLTIKRILSSTFSIVILFFFSGLIIDLRAQCIAPPAIGSCVGDNGAAFDGVNINSGQTFWHISPTGTFNVINLNGGTLRICGNLTLSNINYNGGNILIESGGSLTIDGGGTLNLNGNSIISNRGTLTINKNIVMQNSNNLLINATLTSVLNMNSAAYVLDINSPTSNFVNNGTANINTITVQSSASGSPVCLGISSCLNLTNLNNNLTNSFAAPTIRAVVRYTGNALLNNNLTNTTNLVVCQATGSTTSGSANFGSATIVTNCTSCASAFQFLPIELFSFQGKQENETIRLVWSTFAEINNEFYGIEKLENNNNWIVIGSVPSTGNSAKLYSFDDLHPVDGIQYYRLKQTDKTGAISFSLIISVKFNASTHSISIYPNPNSSNRLNIKGFTNGMTIILDVINLTGQLLHTHTLNKNSVELPAMNSGVYIMTLSSSGNFENKTFKYIVL